MSARGEGRAREAWERFVTVNVTVGYGLDLRDLKNLRGYHGLA